MDNKKFFIELDRHDANSLRSCVEFMRKSATDAHAATGLASAVSTVSFCNGMMVRLDALCKQWEDE